MWWLGVMCVLKTSFATWVSKSSIGTKSSGGGLVGVCVLPGLSLGSPAQWAGAL
jgi:hypothetical protein